MAQAPHISVSEAHGVNLIVMYSRKLWEPYLRQWIGPSLVQVKAYRLFVIKPLAEPMRIYGHVKIRKIPGEFKPDLKIGNHFVQAILLSVNIELWPTNG